jgi:hypothetical protein
MAALRTVLRTLLDHRPAIEAFGADADEALLILPDLPAS